MYEPENQQDFDRCTLLLNNLAKAVNNSAKRIQALSTAEALGGDEDLIEMIRESVIQTHEIAIELAWKTIKAFALKIEPYGRVSGSTTAVKLGLSTGVLRSEHLARVLLEAIQHRNTSSHEYMLNAGLEDYVQNIRLQFNPALRALIEELEAQL